MPATWMTKEQKGWLHARIPQYLESQRMSRIPRALKAIHQEWSDTWPEHDVVCPPKAGEPNLPLTPEQETEVAKITARRYGQILTWFQRNTGTGGRRSRMTLNLGGDATKHKSNRVNHASEIYYEKFRERVRPTYLERLKSQGPLNRGQRLSLLKKVSKELFDQESEEIRVEVMAEQLKQREKKEAALDKDEGKDDNGEQERPEEVQRFIEELPDLMKTALGDVSKKAGGWCFLVLAGGPLPKDGGNIHLFEIWVGPTSKAGYGFPDAHAPYVNEVRQPFSNFVTKVLSTPLAQPPAPHAGVTSTVLPTTTPSNHRVQTPSTIAPIASKTPSALTSINLDAPDLIQFPRSSSLSPEIDKNKGADEGDQGDEDVDDDEVEDVEDTGGYFDRNFESAVGGGRSSMAADADDVGNGVPPHLPVPGPTTPAPTTPSNGVISLAPHQPVDTAIPPIEASKPPFAPGGPSSPIEHAFLRMKAQVAQQQAITPFPLDPRLAAMSNGSENLPTITPVVAPPRRHPNATRSSTEAAEKREIATAKRLATRAKNKAIKAATTATSMPDTPLPTTSVIPTAAPTSALPPSTSTISGNNTNAPGPIAAPNPPPATPPTAQPSSDTNTEAPGAIAAPNPPPATPPTPQPSSDTNTEAPGAVAAPNPPPAAHPPPSPSASTAQPSSDTTQPSTTSLSRANSKAKGKRPSKKAKVDKVGRGGGSSEGNDAAPPATRPRRARHPPQRPDDAVSFAKRGPPP